MKTVGPRSVASIVLSKMPRTTHVSLCWHLSGSVSFESIQLKCDSGYIFPKPISYFISDWWSTPTSKVFLCHGNQFMFYLALIHVVVTGSPNITRPKIDLRKKAVMFTQPLQNLPSIVGGMLHEIFGDSHVCLLHLGGAKCIYYMCNIFNSHVWDFLGFWILDVKSFQDCVMWNHS